MNVTLGPERLFPSAIVFGEYCRVYNASETTQSRATLNERAELDEIARKGMEGNMASLKLKRALHHPVPPACDQRYEPGDQVLVWLEKVLNQRIGEWLGLFTVIAMESTRKLAYVRDA